MKQSAPSWNLLLVTVILANALWFATFYLTFSTFWIKIAVSASSLAVLSWWIRPIKRDRLRFDTKALLIGLVSAMVLYLIFWAGKEISTALFPFAERQIGSVYGKGAGTPLWIVLLLLLCVTGPCEELYWRGFLQERLMERFGGLGGWLLTTVIYAAVHLWSFNFMLVGAAAVAGAFWGALYWRIGNLLPVIISHSLWSAVIFAIMPLS
ncbi:MAG: CPBP family intramembrane metalloprotease [Deltaproteobacteria bacterium]|nr:CPBP family intramembrane metalloprotease [Deltaproteobacteria bacterium]